MPYSPLTTAEPEDGVIPGEGAAASPWLLPVVAAGLTLVLAIMGVLVFFVILGRDAATDLDDGKLFGPSVPDVLSGGRRLLGQGAFTEALQQLQAARDRGERHPDLLQLHREARLLANLSDLSLEEIVEKGQKVGLIKEWEGLVREKYRGRAFVFDDVVARDPDGKHRFVHYEVLVAEERAEIVLNLNLLRQLPLNPPRRLFFGARLSNVTRSGESSWSIELEPDSGVLLTEAKAAAALGLGPLDAQLSDLLREQAGWVRKFKE